MQYGAWFARSACFIFWTFFLCLLAAKTSAAQECTYCEVACSPQVAVDASSPELEKQMLLLTNQYRAMKGLPELMLDETLTRIAREHSFGMACQGFISHNLPTGDLRTRMSRVGYDLEIARENVATAPSVQLAQAALVESSDHEKNILASDVTRIGIGIAPCPDARSRQLFITQIFAMPRGEYKIETVQGNLTSRLEDLRQNVPESLAPDPELDKIAMRSLLSVDLPLDREKLQQVLKSSTHELAEKEKMELARVQASVQVVHSPHQVKIPDSASAGQARSYGSAVREFRDGENRPAFLVLTLIGIPR